MRYFLCRVDDDWKFLCCIQQKEEQLAENIHRITDELLLRRKTGQHPEKIHGDVEGRSRLKDGLKYMRYKVFVPLHIHWKHAFHVMFIKLQLFCVALWKMANIQVILFLWILYLVTHSYYHHWLGMSSGRESLSNCLINLNRHICQVIGISYLILLYLLTFCQCLTSAHFTEVCGIYLTFGMLNSSELFQKQYPVSNMPYIISSAV